MVNVKKKKLRHTSLIDFSYKVTPAQCTFKTHSYPFATKADKTTECPLPLQISLSLVKGFWANVLPFANVSIKLGEPVVYFSHVELIFFTTECLFLLFKAGAQWLTAGALY